MVKVGSMTSTRRVLMTAGVVVLCTSGAFAAPWGKKAKQAGPAPAAASDSASVGMTLSSIELVASPAPRLVLHTSAAPVYTSYSPTPDTFVVDLTGTTKGTALTIPAALPASVSSINADDVTEMGTHLTRVTVHLSQPAPLAASAGDNSVSVDLPVPAVAAESAAESDRSKAPIAAGETPALQPVPVADAPKSVEPAVTTEPIPVAKAKTLKEVRTSGSGEAMEVQLAADGDMQFRAFPLENPSRIVIDVDGVRSAVAQKSMAVKDGVVRRIRVGEFSTKPLVTRIVLDLDRKSGYDVTKEGDHLRVTFKSDVQTAAATALPAAPPVAAPVKVAEETKPAPPPPSPAVTAVDVTEKKTEAPKVVQVAQSKPAPKSEPAAMPAATAPADIPSQVPTIAETSSTWKMPESASKGAKAVINAPQDQPAPRRTRGTPAPAEDVFNDAQQPAPAAPQTTPLGGGTRTLSAGQKVYTGEPISLNLKDADIKDVLRTFSQLTGLNVAIDPDVSGSVTVDFTDVPWDQALEIILRQNNLGYILEGNVMRIGRVDRLASETAANRRLQEEQRLNVPLTSVSMKLSYARASEVAGLLRELASPRARIIVDQRTNQLIITEIPAYLETMQRLIEAVDVPTRQVVIEARIVETSKTFLHQWGFQWGFNGTANPALGTGTGLVFPNRVDLVGGPFDFGPGNPVLSMSLSNVLGTFNLDLQLNAAEAEGLVRVISAPRVTTQDNTAAEIQSGFQIPYQTRINFTTTIQYVDATLRLSVTPQITDAGTVIMDIAVQKNEPATGLAIAGGSGTPLSTRQARTRLMVRDGGTSVIAGIYQTKDNASESRLPVLHSIPIIGNLFKEHNISTSHDELLIFITPRIVKSS